MKFLSRLIPEWLRDIIWQIRFVPSKMIKDSGEDYIVCPKCGGVMVTVEFTSESGLRPTNVCLDCPHREEVVE